MSIKLKITLLVALLAMPLSLPAGASPNCETTHPDNTVRTDDHGNPVDRGFYAVADCRIEMLEDDTFEVLSGDHAQFTAEQQILLRPGFHARAGSSFKARMRDCIRNPNDGEGFAAWGSEGDNGWMDDVAERYVANFSSHPDLTITEKFDAWIGPITDFYVDTATAGGFDDVDVGSAHGIDEGMVFFHVAHGHPNGFHVRDPAGSLTVNAANQNMLLGNCTVPPDTSEQGELRYFLLCACRTFAHGPGVISDTGSWEYDRPSEFVPGIADSEAQRNVVERLGPVLSENVRMLCGVSTGGTCAGDTTTHTTMMDKLWNEYDFGQTVADSWGYGLANKDKGQYIVDGIVVRDIRTTPLCIARGNSDRSDFKSPITEDFRFTNKANPYDSAIHVASWETVNGIVDFQDQVLGAPMPASLPAFSVDTQSVDFLSNSGDFYYDGPLLVSREVNNDGLPIARIDTLTGAIYLTGNRHRLEAGMSDSQWSDQQYLDAAKMLIEGLGWSENDIGQVDVLKSFLQVFPDENAVRDRQFVKLLKDITFTFKRKIANEASAIDMRGIDNRIVIQLNPNGSMKRATKRWKQIGADLVNVPLKK